MFLGVALLLPIVPFLILSESFELRLQSWLAGTVSPWWLATLVVAALAVDIFLPIPSSFVSTLAGARLGWCGGAAASWLGMTLGAVIGFALARRLGYALAVRWAKREDLAQMQILCDRYGPAVLIVTRGLPLLAEAGVLLVGTTRLAWSRFLPPVMLGNLGLALVYACLGDWGRQQDQTALALTASIVVPIAALLLARLFMRHAIRKP
jgi:membrane protein DedA with SNARE-associated domain